MGILVKLETNVTFAKHVSTNNRLINIVLTTFAVRLCYKSLYLLVFVGQCICILHSVSMVHAVMPLFVSMFVLSCYVGQKP